MNLTSDISAVNLVINRVSRQIYDHLLSTHQVHEDEIYCVDEQYLNAKNQPIKNLADPSFPTDAVNLRYLSSSQEIGSRIEDSMTRIVTWTKIPEVG